MNIPNKKPRFSIVIAVRDQAPDIERNLPLLLTQQYDGDYEVIVVDESSTDNTADVLKQLKTLHNHLYTTFLPRYQFQRERQRLALTIGVKAAKYEWVVFADINMLIPSEQWLDELSAFACRPTELLLGYIDRKSSDVRLQTYDDVDNARKLISRTEHRKATGHTVNWMRFRRGWYDFLVVIKERAHETLRMFKIEK